MYYAEKLIDGVWHFRVDPKDEWRPMTVEMLHEKIAELEREAR